MSPKNILRVEFLSCLAMCVLIGAWGLLTFQQWMKGDLTTLWSLITAFFVGVVVFDAYRVWNRLN